ncbi:Ger(x)C family spore germination protein [Scopulibacillus cellulosilyticus]|uniref:Ger(X)C family spore germination protein n=1 Tax=Scopulibacillus cellulosilyticus TaxID=2665665 RepID=A0ABW2PPX4_9BACL
MTKHNLYKFMAVFISLFILSGCWDNKDIDKRVLPLVMGISKKNTEGYKVTLQIPIPEQNGQISRVVTGQGGTVASVLGKIRVNSEYAVDYSHIGLIIINKKLGTNQQEMKGIIKFLMKSGEVPTKAMVAITDDNINNVLTNINKRLGINATSLFDYFNKGAGWAPEISRTPIWEVYQSLFSYTKDIAVPVVRSGKNTVLRYDGSAILKNGEIIGKISPDETQIYNIFQNQGASGKTETFDFTSVMVSDSSLQHKLLMKENKPSLSFHLNLGITILEKKEGLNDKKVKEKLEKVIENRFYNMLKQSQKKKIDLFGFGQYFRNQIPYNELKDWRTKYYPNLNVDFKVNAYLENV